MLDASRFIFALIAYIHIFEIVVETSEFLVLFFVLRLSLYLLFLSTRSLMQVLICNLIKLAFVCLIHCMAMS